MLPSHPEASHRSICNLSETLPAHLSRARHGRTQLTSYDTMRYDPSTSFCTLAHSRSVQEQTLQQWYFVSRLSTWFLLDLLNTFVWMTLSVTDFLDLCLDMRFLEPLRCTEQQQPHSSSLCQTNLHRSHRADLKQMCGLNWQRFGSHKSTAQNITSRHRESPLKMKFEKKMKRKENEKKRKNEKKKKNGKMKK